MGRIFQTRPGTPKRKQNQCGALKLRVRRRAAAELADDARILETHAGDGHLYRALWSRWTGVALEHDRRRISQTAIDRPHWAVYLGDNLAWLRSGLDLGPYDLIDVDPYGEPWPVIQAVLSARWTWRANFVIVATDGYWPQIAVTARSQTLFGCGEGRQFGTSADAEPGAYEARVHRWLTRTPWPSGCSVERIEPYRPARMTRGVGQWIVICRGPTG